jgi:hypothetical protein
MLKRLTLDLGNYGEERYGLTGLASKYCGSAGFYSFVRRTVRLTVLIGADVRRDRFQHVSAGYIWILLNPFLHNQVPDPWCQSSRCHTLLIRQAIPDLIELCENRSVGPHLQSPSEG